jgi:hypothetical protein
MEYFNHLKTALSLVSIKGDLRHRNDHSMEHVPKGFSRWAAASSYIYDVERILSELETARSFVEKLPTEEFLKEYSTNHENHIMYHQGYFLDLMHQLKDKLIQLLYAIAVADRKYSKKEERHIDLKKLMKGKLIVRIKSLKDLLSVWNADLALDPNRPKNPITIALKKRTNYHHYRNPLTNEENYFKAKANRTLLSPGTIEYLNDYGRHLISEKGKENIAAWQSDSLRKMTNTLKDTRVNIDSISKVIISYFKFPLIDSNSGKRIILQFMPLEESIKIPDCTRTISDVRGLFRDLFNLIYKSVKESFSNEFISLYAIGSSTRDDFIFGISDINVVIIIKSNDELFKKELESFVINPPIPIRMPLELKVLSESQFNSSENDMLRFICKTDGILIGGQDLLRNEKNKNKSYKTVWMLNKDFKNKLLEGKEWLSKQTIAGAHRQYEDLARDLAKRALRLGFGQVIGNHAVYAFRYREILDLTNFYAPENRDVTYRNYQLITKRLEVDKAGLCGIIKHFERMFIPLFEAIDNGVNGKN